MNINSQNNQPHGETMTDNLELTNLDYLGKELDTINSNSTDSNVSIKPISINEIE